jgi:hypothetical protein
MFEVPHADQRIHIPPLRQAALPLLLEFQGNLQGSPMKYLSIALIFVATVFVCAFTRKWHISLGASIWGVYLTLHMLTRENCPGCDGGDL